MENFDMNRFFKVFFNSKFYMAFIILTCLAVGYFYSYYYVTPMYQSSATVVLVQNDTANEDNYTTITQKDLTLNKNLLATYTKIAKSNKVLEQVIENLNLDITAEALANLVNVKAVNNTEVFKITVSNKDKELAASITNELLTVFSNEVKTLYHMDNVYTMDQAIVADTPYNINHKKDLIMFFILGIAISFGLVVVLYLLDNTIKTEKDIEEYTGLSVLSTIPMYQDKKETELIVNEYPKSPISECFKTFRTNIMFSIQNKKLNTVLVTSGDMGEGKSFVSSNLAITFAQSGKKVILIDTDMRKGRIHKIFDLVNTNGLSNCLAKIGIDQTKLNINEYIQESTIANLYIMTSGNVPPNPSELLSSSSMFQLLEALNRQYDIVICDGTPCMLVSDSIILSKIVDTTVIVTASKSTKLDTLLKMKKSIEIVGGNIGGTIINKMPISSKSYQNQYYYGNHQETSFINNFLPYVHDTILDAPLYVKELKDVILEPKASVKIEDVITTQRTDMASSQEMKKITNILETNSNEISELKGLYKNVMQNAFDILTEKPDLINPILDELEQIKQEYTSAILLQKEQMESLSSKISNIREEDTSNEILQELTNLQIVYQSMMKQYHEEFENLNNKIGNIALENPSDILLEELRQAKKEYQDTITFQNEQIASLDDKISHIDIPDTSDRLLDELKLIKEQYQDAITLQNEQIASLDDKISHIDIPDTSDRLLDELKLIKEQYQDAITLQNEQIASLDDKISHIDIPDASDRLLDELKIIKEQYQDAITLQNEQIASLDDKISHIDIPDVSDKLLEQIQLLKQNYESMVESQDENMKILENKIENVSSTDASSEILFKINDLINLHYENLEAQNNQIDQLENKIDNLQIDTNSLKLMENFDQLRNEYKSTISFQTEKLTKLENKIENVFTNEEHTGRILEKIDHMDLTYANILAKQNEKIENLEKIWKQEYFKDDSTLLKEVSKIYHQLESMNSRFESLEKRAANNEILIKNLTNEAKNSFYHPTKKLDINQLNRKVVQIQDYLENKDLDKTIPIGNKRNKNILDGQINIIDDLLKNVPSNPNFETSNTPQFIVNYESVKRKQERKSFSLFKSKQKEDIIEDEPISIVSQILSNNQENVG